MAFKHEPQNHIGATNVWLTPKKIIDALGPFDLDPCAACEPRPWPTAKAHFTKNDDGLTRDWFGFVWCNPPYGNHTKDWIKKLVEHDNGIALIFARTETKWFQECVPHCSGLLFLAGRVSFCTQDGKTSKGNAGAPSVLLGFGDLARKRLLNSKLSGFFTTPF